MIEFLKEFKEKILPGKHQVYNSIDDLPIFIWIKIHEKRDLLLLKKNSDHVPLGVLASAWERIYGEFIDVFGVSDKFREILFMKRDIALLKINMALSGSRHYLTFIEIKQMQFEELLKKEVNHNYMDSLVHVEKYVGFKLNIRECSVREYYTYLKEMEKEYKANVSKAYVNG